MPRLSTDETDDGMIAPLRKWLIPIVTLVAVLGSGIAAAEIGGSDEPVIEDPVTTTTEVTTSTTSPEDAPSDDPEGTDDDADDTGAAVERYWGPECGDGPTTNHGQYVASQPNDGASRQAAAHSPCGKPIQTVDVTTTTAPAEPDGDGDDVGDEPVFTSGSSKPGNGHGNGPPPGRGGRKHN